MIEFYTEDKKDIISFSDNEKIIIHNNTFEIHGDVSIVAIRFAKYMLYEYAHFYTPLETNLTDAPYFKFKFKELNCCLQYSENNKLQVDVIWNGEQSKDWIEFKSACDRYFSLKVFY